MSKHCWLRRQVSRAICSMQQKHNTIGSAASLEWWKCCAIYQIYPLSFQDSNGDGKGDLPGILSPFDYLKWLGVGTVWLSPVFRSPMVGFSYDISDYTAIDPVFGTLEDFDRVVAALHGRDIRLILDVVPNHTSDRHPWFQESRSSRSNPQRDWYVWADPAPEGGPPNNWLSRFGGSAWEWDAKTGQYFYHAFLSEINAVKHVIGLVFARDVPPRVRNQILGCQFRSHDLTEG